MNIIYLLETNTKMSVHLLTSMLSVNQVHVLYTCIKYVLIYLVHVYQSIYYMKTNTCLYRQVTRVCRLLDQLNTSTDIEHLSSSLATPLSSYCYLATPTVDRILLVLFNWPNHTGYNFTPLA